MGLSIPFASGGDPKLLCSGAGAPEMDLFSGAAVRFDLVAILWFVFSLVLH